MAIFDFFNHCSYLSFSLAHYGIDWELILSREWELKLYLYFVGKEYFDDGLCELHEREIERLHGVFERHREYFEAVRNWKKDWEELNYTEVCTVLSKHVKLKLHYQYAFFNSIRFCISHCRKCVRSLRRWRIAVVYCSCTRSAWRSCGRICLASSKPLPHTYPLIQVRFIHSYLRHLKIAPFHKLVLVMFQYWSTRRMIVKSNTIL